MADFTGMHPQNVQTNIREFEDQGMIIFYNLHYYNKTFFDSLAKVWFSPNAVEFGSEFKPELYNSEGETKALVNNTIVDCVAAYNTVAASNGYPTVADEHSEFDPVNYAPQGTNEQYENMLDISPEGVVGMDKEKVRAYLEEYRNNINKIQADLDGFPLSIAFYDPDGALLAAYTDKVTTVKAKLEELYTNMSNNISAKLIEEEEKVVAGARNAASTLGGN